jgi:hypothetical protein
MSDDFPNPPQRPLPPEVRDRLRAKLYRDIASQQRRPADRVRGPLSIAAGVAVLAAGAMIVAQSVTGGTDNPPPGNPTTTVSQPHPPLDMEKAKADLDRCFAAAQQAGKADRFPPRTQWNPVNTYGFYGIGVTGIRGGSKTFFCETTHTEVTISDPDATPQPAAGSATAALLQTKLGTLAGVVDESWPWPWAEFSRPSGRATQPLNVRSGLFINGGKDRGPVRVNKDAPDNSGQWEVLPTAPPPAVSIVDRPADPPPDRTSDRGRKLDECVKAADAALGVEDAQSWRPGAVLDLDGERIAMARNEFGFANCWSVNGTPGFLGGGPRPSIGRPESLGSTFELKGGTAVAGVVPEATTRMAVSGQGAIDVHDGTFVVFLPQGLDKDTKATLFAADDRVIYEGPLIN